MTDKPDELVGIREGIQSIIDRWDYDTSKTTLEKVEEILSLTVSRGGRVCPECKGEGSYIILLPDEVSSPHEVWCDTCHGTGKLPVEEKSILTILREYIAKENK